MLPDFPELKRQLNERVLAILKQEMAARAPLLAQVRKITQHEGKDNSFETEEGDIKRIKYKKVEAGIELDLSSIHAFDAPALRKKLNEMAETMARKQMAMFLKTMHRTTEEVGNVVDAGGQPFTAEFMLQVWETIWIEFDEHGKPRMPQLLANPIHKDRAEAEFKRFEAEPQLKAKRIELINRKREEWFDRESHRKLAD